MIEILKGFLHRIEMTPMRKLRHFTRPASFGCGWVNPNHKNRGRLTVLKEKEIEFWLCTTEEKNKFRGS
ncbi:MAG: hypothetical protein KJ757_07985 [Planctomycetes bacterium]|nr:hypothetical protein [Planctomycetota bacterium]MBU1517290.1 hypothetical protein [Planctomycetota bacterium]MBU2457896.1 hypothetical protein [Planctomycetota bacterium]MBU2597482.1 hypothetical protein [Planctomycetota bacterium]